MNQLYEQIASYISRTRIKGPVRVLWKPRFVQSAVYFSRLNGPNIRKPSKICRFALTDAQSEEWVWLRQYLAIA